MSQFRDGLATVHHSAGEDGSGQSASRSQEDQKLPIRDRLRKWEAENPDESHNMITDLANAGELSNTFTRPQNVTMAQFDVQAPLFDGDELSDLRSDDTMLRPGDLVEMGSEAARRPMLAVCLGRFNGYEHYYTSSGKWFSGLGVNTLFVVKKFVDPSELQPLIAEIPTGDVPMEALNALQDLGHGPSRAVGAPMLRKMLEFEQGAEAVYQANAGTLDASSSFIGDPLKHRYLTLHEIADLLLPAIIKKDGKFAPNALYAVHRALLQDEIFFRPLKQTGKQKSYLFEVSPLSEVRIVQRVEVMVREFLESCAGPRANQKHEQSGGAYSLSSFLKRAQLAIDNSRKVRRFSPHGVVGPSKSQDISRPTWTATDLEILQFLELWASYQKFPNYSRFHCIGSAILRYLERYESEVLNSTTGWTFLQEIGWVAPWEISSRYRIRFPDVEIQRGGGFTRPFFGILDRHMKTDIFENRRKQWDGHTAFCIDAESTMDIDDAVSVERTDNPEEYWIHVHVADPASSISAATPIAKYAELVPETIYLPGHYDRMLPGNISQDRFSLAPGRPCLTFSALVNTQGHVLKHNIVPGTLKDVIYITGEAVNDALGETRDDPIASDQHLNIGPIPMAKPPSRKMTRPIDLSPKQRGELALLAELGRTIQNARFDRGATPYFQARPQPEVYFDNVEQCTTSDGFINASGDPSIRITFSKRSGTDLVENVMKLAGEIAAQWCNDRGIPIPYRTQPHAAQNAALIQQYTRDVFRPFLEGGARPEDHHWRHLRALLGGDEISTSPGPHFTIGADMYTKATSPLRRFSDLLVHWQIEAAMLEEQRLGRSLVGNKDDSFLPFTRERMDRMLPMLRVREKQARALANGDGADQWILQALVRAWRFKEAKLPSTYRFTVAHVTGRSSVLGRLNWFDRRAILKVEHMNNVSKMTDVRLGDVFEVKLQDVNVHANQISVEAVRILQRVGVTDAAAIDAATKQPHLAA
ncbi:uncharacterized protein BCR38DRAFT_484013 [Pseudomassariella vexata]|uniref:RNB domain-containing protein n=1 Tax=Pseudomassariella vexata TaxID=1141098 RepID=A0A1Y2E498_9PEZI|nr:uncharacterized protein BCR38DRAFT_484013 [Pseudomassariella vexata]ORY66380.1 hypothetical protein BCR38DRAFT_484013 [Pseudomassariella vexata]